MYATIHHPVQAAHRKASLPARRGPVRVMVVLALSLALSSSAVLAQWQAARPGKVYEFPADHHSHPEFQTEWWYFTGNLQTAEGRELGYQLTWFRQGLRPPGVHAPTRSRFIIENLHFVHLAISDLDRRQHRFAQVTRRGSHGEAGTGTAEGNNKAGRLVWVGPCTLELDDQGAFHIKANDDENSMALDLQLRPTRDPVCNGVDGLSRKGPGASNGSHYYSLTRLQTTGAVRIGTAAPAAVNGTSWFDREWSTSALGENQVGWDWFALRLDDGSDLMIYQIRQADGTADPFSSGSLRRADGSTLHLSSDAFELQPGTTWKSRRSGGRYPLQWRIIVPGEDLDLEVSAAFDNQELALFPVTYWEGAVQVSGNRRGAGYMELTGYSGEVPLH